MSNFLSKLWPVLLAIYIISPFDAHPLFIDDLIASVALFYMIYKNAKRKQFEQYQSTSGSDNNSKNKSAYSSSQLTLDEAYRVLEVRKGASLDEVSKAYKDKMIKSHPDKVSHLSHELQEKAEELTLRLNDAFDLIKKSRK